MALSMKKLQRQLASAKKSSLRMRRKARAGVETVLRTGEVCATSFVFGAIKGRTGKNPEIAGVPLDLGAGILGHVLAMFGIGGGMDTHLRGFADGALSSFSHTQGAAIGANMAAKVSGFPTPEISGNGYPEIAGWSDPTSEEMAGGYGLTEEDLVSAGL